MNPSQRALSTAKEIISRGPATYENAERIAEIIDAHFTRNEHFREFENELRTAPTVARLNAMLWKIMDDGFTDYQRSALTDVAKLRYNELEGQMNLTLAGKIAVGLLIGWITFGATVYWILNH